MNPIIVKHWKVLSTLSEKKKVVLTGAFAMLVVGEAAILDTTVDVLTDIPCLKGCYLKYLVNYCYVDKINYVDYVTPSIELPNVLVPTIERSIIESIKTELEYIDEGVFCDTLERYTRGSDFNYDLLCEVGRCFGVGKDLIDYWIREVESFNSY